MWLSFVKMKKFRTILIAYLVVRCGIHRHALFVFTYRKGYMQQVERIYIVCCRYIVHAAACGGTCVFTLNR